MKKMVLVLVVILLLATMVAAKGRPNYPIIGTAHVEVVGAPNGIVVLWLDKRPNYSISIGVIGGNNGLMVINSGSFFTFIPCRSGVYQVYTVLVSPAGSYSSCASNPVVVRVGIIRKREK